MIEPPILTIFEDDENNITFHIKAYRQLSYAEAYQQVLIALRDTKLQTGLPKRKVVKILTLIRN